MSSITGLGGYASMAPWQTNARSKPGGVAQTDAPGFLNDIQSKGPIDKAPRVVKGQTPAQALPVRRPAAPEPFTSTQQLLQSRQEPLTEEEKPSLQSAMTLALQEQQQMLVRKTADRQQPEASVEKPASEASKKAVTSEQLPALGQDGTALSEAGSPADEAEPTDLVHKKASPNELMQEKMLRQIIKLKEAYSHIQARTGDTKADGGLSVVV